jgi:hypothetical protein
LLVRRDFIDANWKCYFCGLLAGLHDDLKTDQMSATLPDLQLTQSLAAVVDELHLLFALGGARPRL